MKALGALIVILGIGLITTAVVLHSALGPGGILGLGIPGVVSLPLGFAFIGAGPAAEQKAARIARIASAGLAGTATVTGLEQTGTWINDNPKCRIRLNVAIPGRSVYQATLTEVIPQSALPRYQPGASFEVRVDPDDLAAVIIIDSADVIRAAGPAVLATGLAGTARVRSVFAPLLAAVTGEPMWGLELRVQAGDGRPEYAVRLAAGYPPGTSPPRRGDVLAVRVDPVDPRQVAIDWGSAGGDHRGTGRAGRPQHR